MAARAVYLKIASSPEPPVQLQSNFTKIFLITAKLPIGTASLKKAATQAKIEFFAQHLIHWARFKIVILYQCLDNFKIRIRMQI